MDTKKGWRDGLGWLALLAITALAAWLRYKDLDLKPFHHDEGVNGRFVNDILEQFKYRYNPNYYHGPSLYFLSAPALLLLGKTAFALRAVPALFGTLAIPALVLVKDRIGWLGVLTCGVLAAVAPVEVYFSRTAIHEIYNFTFNFTLVGGIYYWWRHGSRWALFLAAASLSLLFATKETTAITVAAMVPAIVLTWYWAVGKRTFPGDQPIPRRLLEVGPGWWRRLHAEDAPPPSDGKWEPKAGSDTLTAVAARFNGAVEAAKTAAHEVMEAYTAAVEAAKEANIPPPEDPGDALSDVATGARRVRSIPLVSFVFTFLTSLWRSDRRAMIISIVLFVAIWALLFSSFFTYPKGLGGFFEAFFGWGQTGVEGKGHEKVWSYFIDDVLTPYYQPLLYVGLPALIVGAFMRDAFSTFNLLWFALTLAVYSAIPYKTPWCVISFSGPLFFGVGIAISAVTRFAARLPMAALRPALSVAPLLVLAWPIYSWAQESYTLNFDEYDVDGHSIIYVQNVREFMDLVDDMSGVLTALNNNGQKPSLYYIRAHNPLRWYVIDFDTDTKWANSYSDGLKSRLASTDIIISQKSQSKDVREAIDMDKYVIRWYHERPGQKLDVFIKKPMWDVYMAAVKNGDVPAPHKPSAGRSYSDERSKELRDARKKR